VFEQEIVRLLSSKDAEDLLCAAKFHRQVMLEIEVLEVLIYDMTDIKSIRGILPLAQNIRALVLKFPFKPIRLFPTYLTFDHLVSLNVNLPHATIASFLQMHRNLETLQLGACGNANTRICPLTHYSLRFPLLVELICPPSCVLALIVGSAATTLFATYDDVRHHRFPMYKLLDYRQFETSATLTTLLIDFDNSTPQLLHRISAAAPALRILKLAECKFSRNVCHSVYHIGLTLIDEIQHSSQDVQMPWQEPGWLDGFRQLTQLVRFEMRAWYNLVENDNAEAEMIMQWVNITSLRLRYFAVLSGIRQNRARRIVWNNGELSVQESCQDYDIAYT
jgi:hypothetical protein